MWAPTKMEGGEEEKRRRGNSSDEAGCPGWNWHTSWLKLIARKYNPADSGKTQ